MVIINGKQNRMPREAAVQMQDAMNAEHVKRIEIITTLPAKYDAEGDAGIIDIVHLKERKFWNQRVIFVGRSSLVKEPM